MNYIKFIVPPLIHYLISDKDRYQPGDEHLSRSQIGVFDLLVVTEGALYMQEGERKWRVGKGEALVLLPTGTHICWKPCDMATCFYWVHFQTVGSWNLVEAPILPTARDSFYVYSPINQFEIYLPRYTILHEEELLYGLLDELNKGKDYNQTQGMWQQQITFQQVLMHLTTMFEEEQRNPRQLIADKTVKFLTQYYEQEIDNNFLKEKLNYHPVYLNRCMNEVHHCTTLEFLKRYRIERSKIYLFHTEQSLEFISSKVGFKSASSYSRCFKLIVGCSPKQFRKERREEKRSDKSLE